MFKLTWARLCVNLDVCTVECTFRTYARPSACFRTDARSAVRDACFRAGARLGCSCCTAWSGRVCAWMRPRFGRDARIGCARAKFFMDDRGIWLNYKNKHMQLKGKRHATESGHAKEHWGRGSTRAIYVHFLLL